MQGDPRLHATWAASHPPSWERAAVRGLLGVLRAEMQGGAPSAALRRGGDDRRANSGGFGLHIAHVADASVVDMLDAARAEGAAQPLTHVGVQADGVDTECPTALANPALC